MTTVVIIGAGFAGAATAAALATRSGVSSVVVEREAVPGAHASGRNAGIARQVEFDPVVRALCVRSLAMWHDRRHEGRPVVATTGGVYLARTSGRSRLDEVVAALAVEGVEARVATRADLATRFPFLADVDFDVAVWCPTDGVADIHAMLLWCLDRARAGRGVVRTRTSVDAVVAEGGRVIGVQTPGGTIGADVVVDASGAWAGHLGQAGGERLPLVALRRHLFTTSRPTAWPADAPVVWHLDEGFYARCEGGGLLCSPCDESPHPPGEPAFDPEAEGSLAEKLTRSGGPSLAGVEVHRGWPCLRTFAPDRRPVVGWDPRVAGLFHVNALGGFGMTTSAAVGELAAALIMGETVDASVVEAVSPARLRVTRSSRDGAQSDGPAAAGPPGAGLVPKSSIR